MRRLGAKRRRVETFGRYCTLCPALHATIGWYSHSFVPKPPHLILFYSPGDGQSIELKCGGWVQNAVELRPLVAIALSAQRCMQLLAGTRTVLCLRRRI